MFYLQGYQDAIKEHCDIYDSKTRKILLSLDEADQSQVLTTLTSKLYDHIVEKVDDIDYGDIPNTKGDVTKLESYGKLTDCMTTIRDLLVEYKQDTHSIDTVITALKNVVDRRELFERGYRYNIELNIITYSTIVLSIISGTSFLVASCIDFIKTPTQEDFSVSIDKVALAKTKSNLLFNNLDKFNKSCAKGELDKCLDYVIKKNIKNFAGVDTAIVVGAVALVGLLFNIVPILRELIFFFYYSRVRVSDYFDVQADLLQMNAYNVENNQSMKKQDREKIVKKQMSIVNKFRTIANKLAVDNKQSEVNSAKEIANDSKKKYKSEEIMDTLPDSAAASSSGALF